MPRKKQTPPLQPTKAVKKAKEIVNTKKPSTPVARSKKPSVEPITVRKPRQKKIVDVAEVLPPYMDPITEIKESKFEELLKHIEELERKDTEERKRRRPIVIGKKLLGVMLSIILIPAIMFTMWNLFGVQKNLFDQLTNQEVLLIMAIESGMLVIPVYYILREIISLIESER